MTDDDAEAAFAPDLLSLKVLGKKLRHYDRHLRTFPKGSELTFEVEWALSQWRDAAAQLAEAIIPRVAARLPASPGVLFYGSSVLDAGTLCARARRGGRPGPALFDAAARMRVVVPDAGDRGPLITALPPYLGDEYDCVITKIGHKRARQRCHPLSELRSVRPGHPAPEARLVEVLLELLPFSASIWEGIRGTCWWLGGAAGSPTAAAVTDLLYRRLAAASGRLPEEAAAGTLAALGELGPRLAEELAQSQVTVAALSDAPGLKLVRMVCPGPGRLEVTLEPFYTPGEDFLEERLWDFDRLVAENDRPDRVHYALLGGASLPALKRTFPEFLGDPRDLAFALRILLGEEPGDLALLPGPCLNAPDPAGAPEVP